MKENIIYWLKNKITTLTNFKTLIKKIQPQTNNFQTAHESRDPIPFNVNLNNTHLNSVYGR